MADDLRLDVTVARRVSYTPATAPLIRQLEKLVTMIPTYRDTRSGRRTATQIRVALLAVGVVTVALWESPWAPLALVACAMALFVPISQSRRRQLVASLRARRKKATRIERTSGSLELSEKHATLLIGDERVRRLRLNQTETADEGDRLVMSVGQKKKSRLVACRAQGAPDVEAWAEGVDLDQLREAL